MSSQAAADRKVQIVFPSRPTTEGAGVKLRRAFPHHGTPRLDPFLLLDAFQSENPDDYRKGFPWHPHRGMETITYVLDGSVEHKDSMGNEGVIAPGDAQWMTAGSGIVHQEMPRGDRKGALWGFQLWANLPGARKMMDPRYQEVKAATIPAVRSDSGATVRVIAGTFEGTSGPVKEIVIEPEYLDVSLPAGKVFRHAVPASHTVFAFVVEGEAAFDGSSEEEVARARRHGSDTVLVYGPGTNVTVTADRVPVRFLLVSGKPIGEPVAWHGPIVMNTPEEIETALLDLERGTFVKHARR